MIHNILNQTSTNRLNQCYQLLVDTPNEQLTFNNITFKAFIPKWFGVLTIRCINNNLRS